MSISQKISIFTTAVRAEFATAYEATAVPAQFKKYTTTIDSTGRFENYPMLTPTPGISQFKGSRRLGKLSEFVYTLVNLEYESSFQILLRDIRDDQTGNYMIKSRELAQKAQLWPGKQVLINAASGKSTPCFDGTNFFASSHTFAGPGVSNNILTGTAAATDGNTHNAMFFITTGPIKPLLWQQRADVDLETNLDSIESKFKKQYYAWVDLEGAAGFGRWHDAILVQWTNTPTLTELQTDLGNVAKQFRQYTLPIALPTDKPEYIHEQLVFSADTCTAVVSPGLSELFRQVFHSDTIIQGGGPVTNVYNGFADLVVTNIISTVS